MTKQIITSRLDMDLYKLNMMYVFFCKHSDAVGRMKFQNRSSEIPIAHLCDQVNEQLDMLCKLEYTQDELDWIDSNKLWNNAFKGFLKSMVLDRNAIKCVVDGDQLSIESYGPQTEITLYELYVLPIVQELYCSTTYPDMDLSVGKDRLSKKIQSIKEFTLNNQFHFADFGTRRRFSAEWQDYVVGRLSNELPRDVFVGTSNVALAIKYGIKAIGTMAHEYLQFGQAIVHPHDSQLYMLKLWNECYRGELGIALSDVVGFDAFLVDFKKDLANLFDGCRHDSGDPFTWCNKLIEHYSKLGIRSIDKTAVFSDGLDLPLAFKLTQTFRGRIRTSFGIGTNLTNDMGIDGLKIVMKLVELNGRPVAKVSDSPGKGMCEDPIFEQFLKEGYGLISKETVA